jgi:hypothetical protein
MYGWSAFVFRLTPFTFIYFPFRTRNCGHFVNERAKEWTDPRHGQGDNLEKEQQQHAGD